MLSTLAFHLTAPSSLLFLTRFATIARLERDPPCRTQMLARYLLELALPQCSFYSHPQSLLAATALHLALRTMGQSAWTTQLEEHTHFSEDALAPCAVQLKVLHSAASSDPLQATRRKYAQDRFGAVAGIPLS